MGSCLSKKGFSSSSSSAPVVAPPPDPSPKKPVQEEEEVQKKAVKVEENVKKEIFVIKQRKSHERRPEEKGISVTAQPESCDCNASNFNSNVNGSSIVAPVRTSSCTKEEVDAILIQCGRLSRSSSGKNGCSGENNNPANRSGSRKYSGSKRSFDFDQDECRDLASVEKKGNINDDDEEEGEQEEETEMEKRHRSPRQTRRASHRRTPSREKDVEHKRSASRDRASSASGEEMRRSGSGGRRLSRSPGRRSEAPTSVSDKSRPGKMVAVPASVSTRDKTKSSAAGITESATGSKRVSAKRNGEVGLRSAASPRSLSPANNARVVVLHDNNSHQQPSLSRNSSRKAEHSPYRRHPLSDIDNNSLRNEQNALKSQDQMNCNKAAKRNRENGDSAIALIKKPSDLQSQKPDERSNKAAPQGTNNAHNSRDQLESNVMNCKPREQQQHIVVVKDPIGAKEVVPPKTNEVVRVATGSRGAESPKPQTISRSRSSRRSRDLDINVDDFNHGALQNPASYASLLLEDIQNFHQHNTTPFALPPCVTKACSILEAVADLNSCTSSNLSSVFSEERICGGDQSKNKTTNNVSSSTANLGKRRVAAKEPFVESEVDVDDDLMEPSLHKYVTVRQRDVMGGDMEQQESSGSNSFVGQQWASYSSREPNSADSTERWTSRSNTGEEFLTRTNQIL